MSSLFNTIADSSAVVKTVGSTMPQIASVQQPSTIKPAAETQQSQNPKFKCVKKLGHGAYANVWLAADQITSEYYAVKVVTDEKYHSAAMYEYQIAKKLDHPNIIKTKNCFKTQAGSVMLVQEYACNGDLFSKVEEAHGGIAEADVRRYFTHMVRAVQHLHELKIVHRDIKPENVVIDAHNVAKMCDFGMAEQHGSAVKHGSGTVPYISPEVLHASSGFAAQTCHDIWALGVVLYVLLTGDFPWQKAYAKDRDYLAYAEGNLARGSWKKFSPQLLSLFSKIFVHPDKRISASDLLASLNIPFFAKASVPVVPRGETMDVTCDDMTSSSARSTWSIASTVEQEGQLTATQRHSGVSLHESLSF